MSKQDVITIDGLVQTPLRYLEDHRGAVLHHLRNDEPAFTQFGESYFSEVLPGAVKAWKRHRVQTQNLAVPIGRVRVVVYDVREGSPTLHRMQQLELGRPDAYFRLQIPPGVWYGFTCISATPALIANCADFPHDPGESEIRPSDDASIPFNWEMSTS